MALKLKPGVKLDGLQPEILVGLLVAEGCFAKLGKDCVVTSALDGEHMKDSLHYKGMAVDLRSRDLLMPVAMLGDIKLALGQSPEFDVIYEGDHFHLEFQVKS